MMTPQPRRPSRARLRAGGDALPAAGAACGGGAGDDRPTGHLRGPGWPRLRPLDQRGVHRMGFPASSAYLIVGCLGVE